MDMETGRAGLNVGTGTDRQFWRKEMWVWWYCVWDEHLGLEPGNMQEVLA